MKDVFKNGLIILLIIAVLYIIFLRECKKSEPCPGKDEIIVPLDVWNKIQALSKKPTTVHIDTVYLKGDIVYVPASPLPKPKPEVKDTTINNYTDSLVNKEINVWYNYKVKGTLIDRSWKYMTLVTVIKEIDSIPYPSLVEVPKPFKVPQNGLYLYGIAGGNKSAFLFGGGLDYITKMNTELGYMYQRFGKDNFHSVKLGIKIKFGKN
jgi:opacity protein-like surface antigen